MERNRDLRKSSISSVNGLPRRLQRTTSMRDSIDQDRQMDLQETVRLGDPQQLQKNDREREFLKRRRVVRSTLQQRSEDIESYRENESKDSSDEEYYEEEEETRIHQHNRTNQVSPTSSFLSNNRRGLRTLRSSPALRASTDEMFGVAIPRRARSAKKLHEYCNTGTGSFGENLNQRRFSPSPATASLIGTSGASPSSSSASMKKKMKYVDRKLPVFSVASNINPSVIQDDIEIEVAEALFDLMKQSQSRSQSLQSQEKVDRDSINNASDEFNISKADDGKDENTTFSVQNEPVKKLNAETIMADSVKELRREGRIEREKYPDDPPQDLNGNLVNGDGFVNKVIVGSPKESESPSRFIKVNACDIQDPTVTNAHNEAIIAEAKKEAKLEIDLMALPSVPPSPDKGALVYTGTDHPKVIITRYQKKSETISKDGALAVAIGMQEERIGLEKRRRDDCGHDDITSVSGSSTQQQQGQKEQKNQSLTSFSPFSFGMSSWSGVLPLPGCIPSIHGVLPINGSARSSLITQPPQFKFSQPRPRRCATHQFLACNIHSHQELMKKSISSGPVASCGTKPVSLKYILPPTQSSISGNPVVGDSQGGYNSSTVSVESVKDRNCDAAMASNAEATINEKSLLQQASHPPTASNFFCGPGFIFPFGQYQTTMLAPANSSGCPQSASPVGNASLPTNRLSMNLPLPSASSAVSLNHPLLTSNEAYMAMLQNNGCPIPIATNIAMPSFKGGSPSMPFFNPSLYSSPMFNLSRNQQQLTTPHASVQSAPQTTNSSSHKQPQCLKQTSENKFPTLVATNPQQSVPNGFVSQTVNPSNSQPINFTMIPPVSMGTGGTVIKKANPPQHGSKSRVELVPQSVASSFGSNASTSSAPMFHMLPDMFWNCNQMKNFHESEGKSLSNSGQSFDLSKADCKEMSALSTVGPPKFDGLARSINFLPSSLTGNQNHQQQFIQGQNPQMHQLQLAGSTAHAKHTTPNGIPGPFLASIFPSNNPVFSHVSITNDNISSCSQLKNSTQEQTHMIFGNNNQTLATPFSNPSISRNMGIGQRNASTVGTSSSTMSALPSQEAEASPGGTGQQKSSSPACRNIVPPILSTCPSQLPELKY